MISHIDTPVVGFVAPSGTGKTQLLKALIAVITSEGFRVAAIKHSHHDFEIDKQGKDSYELRAAGAGQMLIASKHRWALINENNATADEPGLETLLTRLNLSELDLVFVEGFKSERFEKIEVYRAALGQAPLFETDSDIIAVASDTPLSANDSVSQLDINNISQIAQFILQRYALSK